MAIEQTDPSQEDGRTKFIETVDPDRPLSRYNKIRLLVVKRKSRVAIAQSDNSLDITEQDVNFPVQETWDDIDIPELSQDSFFKVSAEWAHRPDLISLAFYGTEQLYWVIAHANNMTDPFAETFTGRRLRIPDRENLFTNTLVK